MKCITKWAAVLIGVAVVIGSGQWGWAEQQARVTGKTRFAQIQESFGTAQIKLLKGENVTQMTKLRRIIVNDDGNIGPPSEEWRRGQEEDFLAVRFNPCVDTQVDSYFICVACTSAAPVAEAQVMLHPWQSMGQFFYWGEPGKLHPATDEATRLLIDRAHNAGMEIFASMRMNDIHDAFPELYPKLTYPLKVQRPDLLIGEAAEKPYPNDAIMRALWSGFDYAHEEVRQHFLDFILGYCPQYDYDGVELDYFRHPLFFKLGEEEENLENMTEFVRQVRQGLNEIGRERGKPYLLAVRVPDTPVMALRTGLDVEQWLKEDLVDLLIVGGGYMPYAGRYKEFIDMAHRYGVPAYPATNVFSDVRETHSDPAKIVRSYASNFWALGGDGVYIFNYFGVENEAEEAGCLNQLGDPDTLLGLDKQYLPDNGSSIIWCGYTNPPGQFPATPYVPGVTWRINPVWIIDGTPIELVVGDDVQKAAQEGLLDEMRLQVKVSDMNESEGITIKVNGVPVPAADIERVAEDCFEATVSAPPLRQGINQIVILPGPGSLGRLLSTVTWLELSVRYEAVMSGLAVE